MTHGKGGTGNASPQGTQRIAKALANSLRIEILDELNKRVMSPKQFAEEFGGSLPRVSHHFRQLEKYGCIEVVEERSGGKRRGAVEHFFKAVERSMFDGPDWSKLPESMKTHVTTSSFQNYIVRVTEAMRAGTIDSRDDRHFTWTALRLDEEAWEELMASLADVFERTMELQKEADLRLAESGARPISATVALAGFESPPESRR